MKQKCVIAVLLVLCLSAFCVVSVCATTYYVTTDGNDNNAGTSWSAAFATIPKAVDVAVTGDEIKVAEGTYNNSDYYGNGCDLYITKGIKLLGGYDNITHARDWIANETIIYGGYLDCSGTANTLFSIDGLFF